MENKTNLPTLAELSGDIVKAFENDRFNLLLNQPPPEKWVKQHPFAKNVSYISIDKVELLLTKIFQEWKVEVMGYSQIFNAVAVQIRLHYKNPMTLEWSYHDGVGAVGIQTDKGAAASDLSAIKIDSVMKALPAAKSYAIKDAADHLGAIFGRDLNRKDALQFSAGYLKEKGDFTDVKSQLELINSQSELNMYWEQMADFHRDTELKKLFDLKKNQLLKK